MTIRTRIAGCVAPNRHITFIASDRATYGPTLTASSPHFTPLASATSPSS